MKNLLVMLTKVFPFDKGEEFIEDEIQMLSKQFSKVILISTSVSDSGNQTREVPENFEVFSINSSEIKKSTVFEIAKLFPYSNYNGMMSESERKKIKGSIKRKLFLTYFAAKSNAVYKKCRNILDKIDLKVYDGVTFYSYWMFDIAAAAAMLKKHYNINSSCAVTRAHGYDIYEYRNSLQYIPLREYLLKNLDMIYPCSKNGRDYLQKLYPEYQKKVQTSYLGTKDFKMAENTENEDTFNIVSCCHIVPLKRVHLLAQSLELLKDSGLKLKWTHFGDGKELDQLKAYADEHLKFMDVQFYGVIKNDDLMKYYSEKRVDLFVNTSAYEGIPVTIMEACSFGIPTIATNVGGTSEIVNEGKTGFLLDKDFKLEELSEKIEYMAKIPLEIKNKFKNNAREMWKQNFCAETNFSRFSKEIKELENKND